MGILHNLIVVVLSVTSFEICIVNFSLIVKIVYVSRKQLNRILVFSECFGIIFPIDLRFYQHHFRSIKFYLVNVH